MWDSMSESETVFNVYESSEPAGPGRNKEVSERVVDIMFRFEAGGGVPNWFTVAHEFAHATGYLDGVSKRVVHQPSKEHERRWGDGTRSGDLRRKLRDPRDYSPEKYNAQRRAIQVAAEVGLSIALPYRPAKPEEF